ncbi:hypothetical protein KI387_041651 [Taxus chinensis]|uniref:Lung seven transmembrane receptor n=1 Tax=Taxus chinensis TaxID=29808 RepID=A0AA38C9H0_TAXCH|nr:hypothetical protein KI387_041651 [Taxus chinensis]
MANLVFSLFLLAALLTLSAAEIRLSEIRSDARSIIPFDEFGFTHRGRLEIAVTDASYKAAKEIDPVHMGFFLSTRDAWIHVLQQLERREIHCVLNSKLITRLFTFNNLQDNKFNKTYDEVEANQFTLVFANCIPDTLVSMNVRTAMYNLEGANDSRDYLSAGETLLPKLYFGLFVIYLVLAGVWIYVVVKNRAMAYRIHVFMIALICLKALNLICEAEDKSFIKKTGTAHGWDVLFYIFSFLKGIMLFTLIVLIGTGWSFLKPYLQGKEKKVLMVVIPLQVIANIATVVIDETGPNAKDWLAWKQMFLLVDVICCCAVLFPIVWSIKSLREAAHTDGKAAVNLMKLTLFRQYYIVVVGYIYFTRVVVYALATITAYQYAWTSILAGELATLGFYVFTGYKFQPVGHNPYFVIDDDEEEAAAQALKMDDDFEL